MSLKDSLNARRLQAWEQAKELADRAAAECRAFSGEEEQTWTRINAEIDALDERIKTVIEAEKRAAAADAAMNSAGKPKLWTPGGGEVSEFRAWASGQSGQRSFDVKPQGPVNYRDLTVGTTTAGGNTVPTSFYNRLMQHLIQNGALMGGGVTVLNTASGENLDIPKTTSHSTASLTAEAAAISESDPAFGKVTLSAYKYATSFQVSSELVQDTGVDLEGYLAEQAGRALGNAFGAHIVTGTGSSQPKGIVPAASSGVTGPTGASGGLGTHGTANQGGDVLIDLFHSVIAPYRNQVGCGWLMNDTTAAAVRKIQLTTGEYMWQPGLSAGQPDRILARPVVIDPNVASMALNAKSIVFGDFSKYVVRVAGGVRFERSDDFAFSSDLVTYRAIMRADGNLVDTTGAVKYFVGAAT